MEHAELIQQIRTQSAALRTAAELAGPDAPVPTCPGWDVRKLVRHIAGVHQWAGTIVSEGREGAERPEFPRIPKEWTEVLDWWEQGLARLLATLTEAGQNRPTWAFQGVGDSGFWARRQAHETAIHRLDAEHALAGVTGHAGPHTLVFDPHFAADGVDEVLVGMLRLGDFSDSTASGTVLFHAADAGRAWTVELTPGQQPVSGPVHDAATNTDATVAGTADALYRAVWKRPSTAVVTGDRTLLAALPTI